MILLIDNYDSFSFNLYQYLGELCSSDEDQGSANGAAPDITNGAAPDITVVRNDAIDARGILELAPTHVVISPGPGYPADAGNCLDIVRELSGKIPLLGVCLGHQAICQAFGGSIVHAKTLMHGKQSPIAADPACPLFEGIASPFEAARYHSLAVDQRSLPDVLKPVAHASDGEVMAVQHTEHLTFGVQFHPESIMTPCGKQILRNFLVLSYQ